jgi:peroxiredoxin
MHTQDMKTTAADSSQLPEVLRQIRTERGTSLLELVDAGPVLLVFLRHFGCSYCRQAIHDVAAIKDELETRGVRPIFVHLGTRERAKPYFDHYGLSAVERVSDPEARLYRHPAFHLPRTHPLSHFLKPKVLKGWLMGGIRKYGIGGLQDDTYQMPGVFFLRDRQIVNAFRFQTIADQPDYLALLDSMQQHLRFGK